MFRSGFFVFKCRATLAIDRSFGPKFSLREARVTIIRLFANAIVVLWHDLVDETDFMRQRYYEGGRYADRNVRQTNDSYRGNELDKLLALGRCEPLIAVARDTYPGSPVGKRALTEAMKYAETESHFHAGWWAAAMVYGPYSSKAMEWWKACDIARRSAQYAA